MTIAVIAVAFALSHSSARKSLPVYSSAGEFSLTNQLGRAVSARDLAGRIWLADVIFSRCPAQCLRLTKKMSVLQKRLAGLPDVRLVSLTIDPVYDTPEILQRYAAPFGAPADQWLFLTGDKREIVRLAVDGLKFSAVDKDPAQRESINDLFIHSTQFALVDGRGRVRGWFDGDEPGAEDAILGAVAALQKEGAR